MKFWNLLLILILSILTLVGPSLSLYSNFYYYFRPDQETDTCDGLASKVGAIYSKQGEIYVFMKLSEVSSTIAPTILTASSSTVSAIGPETSLRNSSYMTPETVPESVLRTLASTVAPTVSMKTSPNNSSTITEVFDEYRLKISVDASLIPLHRLDLTDRRKENIKYKTKLIGDYFKEYRITSYNYIDSRVILMTFDYGSMNLMLTYHLGSPSLINRTQDNSRILGTNLNLKKGLLPFYELKSDNDNSNKVWDAEDYRRKVPLTLINIKEFTYAGGVLSTESATIEYTEQTLYFGFNSNLTFMYISREIHHLSQAPDYRSPQLYFGDGSNVTGFRHRQYLYLLAGSVVIYFRHFNITEVWTRFEDPVIFLVPMESMDRNVFFRCLSKRSSLKLDDDIEQPKYPPETSFVQLQGHFSCNKGMIIGIIILVMLVVALVLFVAIKHHPGPIGRYRPNAEKHQPLPAYNARNPQEVSSSANTANSIWL